MDYSASYFISGHEVLKIGKKYET